MTRDFQDVGALVRVGGEEGGDGLAQGLSGVSGLSSGSGSCTPSNKPSIRGNQPTAMLGCPPFSSTPAEGSPTTTKPGQLLQAMLTVKPYRVLITTVVPPGVSEYLHKHCGSRVQFYESNRKEMMPRPTLLKLLRKHRFNAIFVTVNDKINAEALDAAGPDLKVVSTMSVGFDHVDLKECAKRGIRVANTPRCVDALMR